jgi:hypothetical protein
MGGDYGPFLKEKTLRQRKNCVSKNIIRPGGEGGSNAIHVCRKHLLFFIEGNFFKQTAISFFEKISPWNVYSLQLVHCSFKFSQNFSQLLKCRLLMHYQHCTVQYYSAVTSGVYFSIDSTIKTSFCVI